MPDPGLGICTSSKHTLITATECVRPKLAAASFVECQAPHVKVKNNENEIDGFLEGTLFDDSSSVPPSFQVFEVSYYFMLVVHSTLTYNT